MNHIPSSPAYGVYVSQLIHYAKTLQIGNNINIKWGIIFKYYEVIISVRVLSNIS